MMENKDDSDFAECAIKTIPDEETRNAARYV